MIPFLRYTKLYLAISSTVIGIGLLSIILWGYRISIDFTGGTTLRYQVDTAISSQEVSAIAKEKKIDIVEIDMDNRILSLRTKVLNEQQESSFRKALEKEANGKITVLATSTVGPVIGAETLRKTAIAAAVAMVGILFYVAYAFWNINFALAAITALLHDILVVVGTYSLISYFFGAEVDTLFVTALLTTMSFSVHDTIVVFDQIREYKRRYGAGYIEDYANKALTDTMVRSFNNSMTIVFMLLALVLLGGETIRFFALTLLVGTITGTYSSPFVATPVAVWLEKRRK